MQTPVYESFRPVEEFEKPLKGPEPTDRGMVLAVMMIVAGTIGILVLFGSLFFSWSGE